MNQRRDLTYYEVWFRAEVEQALREADDPNVQRIPNEVVMTEIERECAELQKRIIEISMFLEQVHAD